MSHSPVKSRASIAMPTSATIAAATGASRREWMDVSHRAAPATMNVKAVSWAILGQFGTRLTSASTLDSQPAKTRRPMAIARNAAKCAKNRIGSAPSGLLMRANVLH
jgi:hypothetical protein